MAGVFAAVQGRGGASTPVLSAVYGLCCSRCVQDQRREEEERQREEKKRKAPASAAAAHSIAFAAALKKEDACLEKDEQNAASS